MIRTELAAIIIVLIAMNPLVFADQLSPRVTPCGNQKISWNFSSGATYEIERWSRADHAWHSIGGSSNRSVFSHAQEDEGLFQQATLYRIQECSHVEVCKSSPAVWFPFLACQGDRTVDNLALISDIVEFLDPQGSEIIDLGLSRNFPIEDVILQYNINLVLRELGSMRGSASPMTKPKYVDLEDHTWLDILNFNIYVFYESWRTGGEPDVSGTGLESLVNHDH